MNTFEYHPITNSVLIGTCPDGTPLRSWSEGSRTFIEIYVRFTAASGTTYGLVNVLETTAI
jgi:hypothetical protein